MRSYLLVLLSSLLLSLNAQENFSNGLLFWTTQEWPCDFIKINIYTLDTLLVDSVRLNERYQGVNIPNCQSNDILVVPNLEAGRYFFEAQCYQPACGVCGGEGSFWQPTVQNETPSSRNSSNKGNVEGVWKTCYTCGGNGKTFNMIWLDTFSIDTNQCRMILFQ